MRRVLVTGSRKWVNRPAIWDVLKAELQQFGGLHVIQGGADGADDIAERWAYGMNQLGYDIRVTRLVPDYDRWGKKAPLVRNGIMARDGADVCHAFPLKGTGGTRQCMSEAFCYGIPVVNHGFQPYTAQAMEWARCYGSILKGLDV
ncbi:DUF2493 domain-containing protein [Mycobacterium avium]|uniref:SLOG family protein n=1 Tax=Mycobacterium avium TaxID=1764 RepID=UPI001CDA5AD7|nr:SLOG family protein [Mycobacterium avium]MCA2331873.1 DUF2493 domain-containing protein [Mycobacterium avium]